MVEVCLPGTGGVVPLQNRWLSCCWVESQGKKLLIDCGEGTQIALKSAGCGISHLSLILITHFHADHVAGLPGLLLTLGNQGKTSPLTIAGPPGLIQVVSALTSISPNLPYPLDLMELSDDRAEIIQIEGIAISSLPLRHGIPCLGYRISVLRKPVFNPDKAALLHVPKRLYTTLHEGKAITLESGETITPDMVIDKNRASTQICYATDTQFLEELISFAWNTDLLISEGMHGDENICEKMKKKGHMLFSDSAHIARQANAKQLWLTHYSPALTNPVKYLDAARSIFPATILAYDGIRTTLGKRADSK